MPWTQLGPASEPAPPAGRDDTAQPDPAVIERAAKAIWEDRRDEWETMPPWDQVDDAHRERGRSMARAAATVIVPATAEQIAAAIEQIKPIGVPAYEGHRIEEYPLIFQGEAVNAARSFAPGLSADATGGDGDE